MFSLTRLIAMTLGGFFAICSLLATNPAFAEQSSGEIPQIPCQTLISPQFTEVIQAGGYSPDQLILGDSPRTSFVFCYLMGTRTFEGSFSYQYISPEITATDEEYFQEFFITSTSTTIGQVSTVRSNSDGPASYYFALRENGYTYTVNFARPYEIGEDGEIPIPVVGQLELDQLSWMKEQVNSQLAILYPQTDKVVPLAPSKPGSIDTPSVLSQLDKFDPANISAAGAAAVGATSIVFAALLSFPTRLMQAGVSKNYSRYVARYRLATSKFRSRFEHLMDSTGRIPRVVKLGVGLVVASCISGFLNPGFGINLESLRVFGSIFVANLIETVLVFGLLLFLLKKRGVQASVSLKLGSLVIVLVTVVASRLTGFEPGIVFGLVLSLVVLTPGHHKSSLVIFAEWLILVGIGLTTWMLFSALPPIVDGESSPVMILLSETLSSLTIGSLASLPIAMLPFSGLPGKTLADDNWFKWKVHKFLPI